MWARGPCEQRGADLHGRDPGPGPGARPPNAASPAFSPGAVPPLPARREARSAGRAWGAARGAGGPPCHQPPRKGAPRGSWGCRSADRDARRGRRRGVFEVKITGPLSPQKCPRGSQRRGPRRLSRQTVCEQIAVRGDARALPRGESPPESAREAAGSDVSDPSAFGLCRPAQNRAAGECWCRPFSENRGSDTSPQRWARSQRVGASAAAVPAAAGRACPPPGPGVPLNPQSGPPAPLAGGHVSVFSQRLKSRLCLHMTSSSLKKVKSGLSVLSSPSLQCFPLTSAGPAESASEKDREMMLTDGESVVSTRPSAAPARSFPRPVRAPPGSQAAGRAAPAGSRGQTGPAGWRPAPGDTRTPDHRAEPLALGADWSIPSIRDSGQARCCLCALLHSELRGRETIGK